MKIIHGFPPLVGDAPRVLVLGSMPGKASLRARQYYAHPRNLFWPLLGEILGFDPALPYARRVAALTGAGVAVWDVLRTCSRGSSLDADIVDASVLVNDFVPFFARHATIRRVGCNGAKAEALLRRHVLPRLAAGAAPEVVRLPSTSPANAAVPRDVKLAAWGAFLVGSDRDRNH